MLQMALSLSVAVPPEHFSLCYGYGWVEDPAVVRAEFQIFDQGAGKVLQTISVPKEQWKAI